MVHVVIYSGVVLAIPESQMMFHTVTTTPANHCTPEDIHC